MFSLNSKRKNERFIKNYSNYYIMLLNFLLTHQQQQGGGNSRFSRQLSNPAYFNPRMRMGAPPNVVNPLMKNPMMVQTGNHFGDVPRNVQR